MDTIYLAPSEPRLVLATEADLKGAIDQGLLAESHYLELKSELEPGKAKNKEHARDLASFAVDGGTVLIGVLENKEKQTLTLTPVALDGLRERVESIARSVPDPPLPVSVRAIRTAADPARGYLVVQVPPSPAAPHMVEHRYLGRGDTQKVYLSDGEVLRLHERRRASEADALWHLERAIERDPIPAEHRRQAHLFLIAEPARPRPEMFLPSLDSHVLRDLLISGAYGRTQDVLPGADRFSPDIGYASNYSRRADGAAVSTANVGSDRSVSDADSPYGGEIVDVEFSEDGAVRIVMTRLSGETRPGTPSAQSVIFDDAAVIYCRRLIGIVLAVAESTGYLGTWQLAAGATGLQGLISAEYAGRSARGQAFEVDEYKKATLASYAELLTAPGAVTTRLLGRFLRKLNTERYRVDLLRDAEPPALEEAPGEASSTRLDT